MRFPVHAITLDLDDTLWPFAPIGARIERVLEDWLQVHAPATAALYPPEAMRTLRDRTFADNPHLHHDLSRLRRMTLEQALRDAGDDATLLDAAYEVFFAERNRVECYPDAIDALARIAAKVPMLALTNGNADVARCGVGQHFVGTLHSRTHGAAKPAASIFLAACEELRCDPALVLHVGDHAEADAAGAARAGLRSCWLNRAGDDGAFRAWDIADVRPDLEFPTLTALADWLDAADDLRAPGRDAA